MSDANIKLADMISALRNQLVQAQTEGKESPIQFDVAESEIEIQFTATKEIEGKAGVEFWVVNAGGEGRVGSEAMQKMRLKLRPVTAKGDPARISDLDERSS